MITCIGSRLVCWERCAFILIGPGALMAAILVCPNGHQWEISQDDPTWQVAGPSACPICGVLCSGTSESAPAGERNTPARATGADLPRIPGYELLGLLGQGGMGRVYKARHLRLGRLVALKMIAGDYFASPQQLARFQLEAQALARVHDAHIVQIYEVAESGGRPYIALEFLEGGSLDARLAHNPQPPAQAAHLVETLARAMHAAHLQGIVHRDLKPANILLDSDGQPKISDFGLAKILEDDSSQTQTGAMLGTPTYMSPEQASGHIRLVGPATDVYALGTILYEMLTGQPPFRGLTTPDTLELIRYAEPISPKRLQPRVPRDLETICLKCLEKAIAKRYASALELADDLARFLAHEPINARRAGVGERLGKLILRQPVAAGLLGVTLAVILAFLSFGLWSHFQLRSAAERTEERFLLARSVVDDMYTNVAEELLLDEPTKDPLRQKFLEKALGLYEEFAREKRNDPEIQRETAQAHFRLGQIYRLLNRYPQALEAYDHAAALQESLRQNFADPRHRQDLANTYNWRGELFREMGSALANAEANYGLAEELQKGLAEEFPDRPVYRQELARSHYNLGIAQMEMGRPHDAESNLNSAMGLLHDLHSAFPETDAYAHELARCFINRGVLNKERQAADRAEKDYRQAIDLLLPWKEQAPGRAVFRIDLATAHKNLGNLLWSNGRNDEALEQLGRAQEILDRLAADFPDRPGYKTQLANAYNSAASVLASAHDLPAAGSRWHLARARLEDLVRNYPEVADYQKLLGITLGNLGWLSSQQGNWQEARDYFQQAVAHLHPAQRANPANPEVLAALRNQCQSLAEAHLRLADHAAAAQAAGELAELSQDRAQDAYHAACFLARCLPLAANDSRLTAAQRQLCGDKYADRALTALKSAVRSDAAAVKRLPQEQEVFQPLAHRAETKKLLAELGDAGARKP